MDSRTEPRGSFVLDRFTNPYFADVVVTLLRERGINAALEREPRGGFGTRPRRLEAATLVLVSARDLEEARWLLDRIRFHGQAGMPPTVHEDSGSRHGHHAGAMDTTMTDDRATAAMKRMKEEIRDWQTRLDELRVKGSIARLEAKDRGRELLGEFDRAFLGARDTLDGWRSSGDREWSAVAAALEEGWRAARKTWKEVREGSRATGKGP